MVQYSFGPFRYSNSVLLTFLKAIFRGEDVKILSGILFATCIYFLPHLKKKMREETPKPLMTLFVSASFCNFKRHRLCLLLPLVTITSPFEPNLFLQRSVNKQQGSVTRYATYLLRALHFPTRIKYPVWNQAGSMVQWKQGSRVA